ncbi:MAG: HD domain-containing protein [Nanohaloarchaea archaeon]|nr:HD domain-containing protein [Candidatus Nanohaloarchaea archaeon]
MKKQFISDITSEGKKVESTFALKFKKPPVDYKSNKEGKWFEMRLADKTGEITAKYWGNDEKKTLDIYDSFSRGCVVSLTGTVQEYPKGSNNFSISIDSAIDTLKVCEIREYDVGDFVATTTKDIDKMLVEVRSILASVKDKDLIRLVMLFVRDKKFMDLFSKTPAAMEYHQNYVGGLLEHTLNVMKIADNVCSLYPELDRDLVVSGAFLHDIGKMSELELSGTLIGVSHEGMLIGHTVIGHDMVSKRIAGLDDFPVTLKLKLLHIVLSHNGHKEYGSPKVPQLPEAVVIHHADDCDAKVDIFLRLKREANTDDPWIWDKKIKGHVYLE